MSLPFLLIAFDVVLAPGTGVACTLALALGQGRGTAACAALGCTLGILPHLAAAILGVAALLHTSALLLETVRFAGVAYLLCLAFQALRSGDALNIDRAGPAEAESRIARRGALINILNPKLLIFFLAPPPPFLSGEPATAEMVGLGAVFMAMRLAVFLVYGLFAAATRDRVRASAREMRWLNRTFAAVSAGPGLRLALERA